MWPSLPCFFECLFPKLQSLHLPQLRLCRLAVFSTKPTIFPSRGGIFPEGYFKSPRGIFNKTHPSPLSKKHPLNAQPWPGWVAGCRVWADSNTTPSGPSCRARAPIPMSRLIPRPVSVFPRCGSFGQSRQLSAGPRARTAHLDVSLWSGVKTHHSVRTNVCSSMTCMLFKRPKARSYEHFQT